MGYATWQDAREHLDIDALGGEPEPVRLQAFVTDIERAFENEVRDVMRVPISQSEAPETFALAKRVCSLRGAAVWLRFKRQAGGDRTELWYADELDRQADELVAQLLARKQPDDAGAPTGDRVYLPYSGAASNKPAALFTRANIADGSGHW